MKLVLLSLFFALSFAHFEACESDRQTFCADLDHHEVRQCMHEHWDQLSESCKTAITEFVNARHERIHAACASDEDTLCAESKSDELSLRQCMRNNWESVSQACKDAVGEHHRHHHSDPQQTDPQQTDPQQTDEEHEDCPMGACAQDVQTLCPDVSSMEEAHECIKTNWDVLSTECRTAVEEFLKAHSDDTIESATEFETTEGDGSKGDSIDGVEGGAEMAELKPRSEVPAWQYWLARLWWTYPVGLVLIIQIVAIFRIRNIRRLEAQA
jgi:hypothetical protein